MGGQIEAIITLLVALIMIVGASFSLLAALGVIRFPDLYTRMHAASKAGTVGSGLLLFAAGLHSLDPAIFARALAAFVFFVLTAPISAHLLAKAAHQAGYRMSRLSVIDQLPQKEEARSL